MNENKPVAPLYARIKVISELYQSNVLVWYDGHRNCDCEVGHPMINNGCQGPNQLLFITNTKNGGYIN